MKYFNIEAGLSPELLERFMDFYNNNQEGDITIVVNSGGGKEFIADVIAEIINNDKDRFTFMAVACYSSAFKLLYNVKCNRVMVNGCMGMMHKSYIDDIVVNSTRDYSYSKDICAVKTMVDIAPVFFKDFMTPKEIKKYNKGDDVFFTFNRMKEIFPQAKVIGT